MTLVEYQKRDEEEYFCPECMGYRAIKVRLLAPLPGRIHYRCLDCGHTFNGPDASSICLF